MCTVSWFSEARKLHLFFNRDEQRSRAPALRPVHRIVDGVGALLTVDAAAGGAWCSVNDRGLVLALLNFYQTEKLYPGTLSRGSIVKACAGSRTAEDCLAHLKAFNLHLFSPFSLLMLSSDGEARKVVWDGTVMKVVKAEPLEISSSVAFEEVSAKRRQCFHRLVLDNGAVNIEDFRAFHRSHQPERSHRSVCMHREDAKTVSYTEIAVGTNEVELTYSGASPCMEQTPFKISLARQPDEDCGPDDTTAPFSKPS